MCSYLTFLDRMDLMVVSQIITLIIVYSDAFVKDC